MSSSQICNLIRSENLTNDSRNGISCEWDADGWLHVHGTQDGGSSEGVTSKNKPIHLEAGEYVILAEVEDGGLGKYSYVSVWPTDDSRRIGIIFNGASYCALSVTKPVDIYLWVGAAGDGHTVDYRMRFMLVEGTTPAAWAPAEGETLVGVGARMSANLWDASAANLKPDTYGVYIVGKTAGGLSCNIAGASVLSANQTVHFGASLRGAGKGYLSPFVEYKDSSGNLNCVGFPHWIPTSQWQRFDGSCVVPSGMTITRIGFNKSGATGNMEVLNPTFSYGSPLVLAIASSTLAWSAGILATVRYYQLAAPTAATPTVPTSSSSLGSWTETEPTADVTKVLWTCERTVYADGTESWSKASKSTSYEAAKDAKSTATDAQSKAQDAQDQVEIVAANLRTTPDSILATIDSKVSTVQQGVDSNDAGLTDLNNRLTSEIKARRSFMRFSEESSDPTLTLGQTDSPAQVKLTNKQLQFLYLNTVVAYMSGDALLINNAKILQQLQLGGFAFVPRDNGNLAFKWVGGDS